MDWNIPIRTLGRKNVQQKIAFVKIVDSYSIYCDGKQIDGFLVYALYLIRFTSKLTLKKTSNIFNKYDAKKYR